MKLQAERQNKMKKKHWKVLLGIVLAIVLLVGGGFIMRPLLLNASIRNKELVSCYYRRGGDMMGSMSTIHFSRINDSKAQIVTQHANAHNERIETNTYSADPNKLQEIKDMAIRYQMYSLSKRGMSPFQVMDGATSTISFSFDDGTYFSVSDNQNISLKDIEHMQEIRDFMVSCEEGEPVTEIERHQLYFIVDGYYFTYEIYETSATETLIEQLDNKTVEDYESVGKCFRLEKPLDVSTCELMTEETSKGYLVYETSTQKVIILYDSLKPKDDLYVIGEATSKRDSAYQIISSMEEKEYTFGLDK